MKCAITAAAGCLTSKTLKTGYFLSGSFLEPKITLQHLFGDFVDKKLKLVLQTLSERQIMDFGTHRESSNLNCGLSVMKSSGSVECKSVQDGFLRMSIEMPNLGLKRGFGVGESRSF